MRTLQLRSGKKEAAGYISVSFYCPTLAEVTRDTYTAARLCAYPLHRRCVLQECQNCEHCSRYNPAQFIITLAVGGALERQEGWHAVARRSAPPLPRFAHSQCYDKLGRAIPRAAGALLSARSY